MLSILIYLLGCLIAYPRFVAEEKEIQELELKVFKTQLSSKRSRIFIIALGTMTSWLGVLIGVIVYFVSDAKYIWVWRFKYLQPKKSKLEKLLGQDSDVDVDEIVHTPRELPPIGKVTRIPAYPGQPGFITLATLEEVTAQEVFNQVARHLLTQKKRSMIGGACAYRGDNGTMCAAGCLMSDEEAQNINNSVESNTVPWIALVDEKVVTKKHFDLISQLQYIHDVIKIDEWLKQLIDLAKHYNLDYTIVKTLTPTVVTDENRKEVVAEIAKKF